MNDRKWSLTEAAEFVGNTEAVIEKHYLIKNGKLSFDARERDRDKATKGTRLTGLTEGRKFRAHSLQLEDGVGQ